MLIFSRQAKCFLWFIAPLMVLSSLCACSLKLNEPAAQPQAFSVRSESQVCLKETSSVVERFLEGKASVSEIDSFWSCLDRSVHFFLLHTNGEDPNSYKPRELANFLGKYFLHNTQIPDSFISQVMRLKKGLFSGSEDRLTREEILKFLRLFSAFSAATKALAPHMPISLASLSDEKMIQETAGALDSAAQILGTAMEEGLGSYKMADLSALLRETGVFFQANGWSGKWVNSLKPYLPILASIKGIAISPPREEMLPADWLRFFQLAPRYFALYLRYQLYFGQNKTVELKGDGIYQLVSILDQGMPLLEESMRSRRSAVISSDEIDELLDRAEELKLLPYSKAQLREVFSLLLKRVLPDPEAKGRLQISLVNLNELRTLYSYFTDGLREIEGGFRAQPREIDRAKARQIFSGTRSLFTAFNNAASRIAIADVRKNLDEINVAFDSSTKFAVVRENGSLPISAFHLQRLHYLRTLSKLLLRAYGNPTSQTINERQILAMLSDLQPVFQLFKIDDAELRAAVPSRLFEGSLFLPSSDGGPSLKMNEAIELEALFLSVIEMAPQVHKFIAKACRVKEGEIHASCYRKAFAENLEGAWKNVPGLSASLLGTGLDERLNLLVQLDTTLRKGKAGSAYSEGDTKSLLLMGYYIELLFFRFDQNRNGMIEQAEAKRAFPLFRGFIGKKAAELGRTNPDEHFKIYTYILAHQKVPKSFWEKIGYLTWKSDNSFSIDRSATIDIFSTLLAF